MPSEDDSIDQPDLARVLGTLRELVVKKEYHQNSLDKRVGMSLHRSCSVTMTTMFSSFTIGIGFDGPIVHC